MAIEPKCCKCGTTCGLWRTGRDWWCPACMWAEVERLRERARESCADFTSVKALVEWAGEETIKQLRAEVKRLQKERRQVCRHLVGRDDCEDVPGVVAAVLDERMEAQKKAAEVQQLRMLQTEVAKWSHQNFGGHYGSGYRPLLGALEELGELAHAHLKAEQGIRGNEDHYANKIDAIGDIIIYLLDYADGQDIDLEEAVVATWATVKRRNWKKHPALAAKAAKGK